MAWLCLALFGLYFALAFGLRSVVQYRSTGSTGFRGLRRGAPAAERVAAGLMVVALALGILAPVLDLTGRLEPVSSLDHPAFRWLGVGLYALGLVGTLAAQFRMGASWRIGVDPGERTALVTEGVFRHVRNPIFTAMTVTALGLALLVPNLAALAGVLVLLVALEVQVRVVEEPYLRSVHGHAYASYAARSGRFFPGVGRLS